MKRIAACCFTGHRPEKLNVPIEIILEKLEQAIEDAFSDGFTDYITGMSRGVDIWAAEKVLDMKKEFPHIRLICAVPFDGFEKEWEQRWQDRYQRILQQADEIHYICNRYMRGVYQKRNEWMVDHASMLIAGYTGAAGGTRNTIKYAQGKKDYIIRYV